MPLSLAVKVASVHEKRGAITALSVSMAASTASPTTTKEECIPVMLHKDHTAATVGGSMTNPYSHAYYRGLGKTGIKSRGNGRERAPDTLSYGLKVA
jgi:hypothetical protein